MYVLLGNYNDIMLNITLLIHMWKQNQIFGNTGKIQLIILLQKKIQIQRMHEIYLH